MRQGAVMDLPRLFVIGDSISIQYGDALERRIAGTFRYDRKRDDAGAPRALSNLDVPTGANGGDSAMVLAYLRHRRATDPISAEVLLLNCGLHDIKTDPATRIRQVEPAAYEANLRAIVAEVAAMGPALVWVRTTPADEYIHNPRNTGFWRFAADVAAYNGIADRVMAEAAVPGIDLHGFSQGFLPAGFCDHVHYTEPVREEQARFIAERLTAWWQARRA